MLPKYITTIKTNTTKTTFAIYICINNILMLQIEPVGYRNRMRFSVRRALKFVV